jgi:hypothetical protein
LALSLPSSALNLHMTKAMTLHLAKKAFVQSFNTSKLLGKTRSMVLILFRDQRSRSSLGLRALGVSNFLAFLLPVCLYPGFMICRQVSSHRSAAVNRFGVSGFGSFKVPSCTFSQSAFTHSRRSLDACPLESTVDIYFDLQAFEIF